MTRRISFARVLLLAVALAPAPASAWGVGGSLGYGHTSGHLQDVNGDLGTLRSQANSVSVGFIADSNLARRRIFNYRINLGLEFVREEVQRPITQDQVHGAHLNLDQTFGFALVRTPRTRIFLGPSLHLGYGRVDERSDLTGVQASYDRRSFSAGIGPELGVNIHAGRHLTFSTSVYGRNGFQVQSFHRLDSANQSRDFLGPDLRAGVATSAFFRFANDQFGESPRRGERRSDSRGDGW